MVELYYVKYSEDKLDEYTEYLNFKIQCLGPEKEFLS